MQIWFIYPSIFNGREPASEVMKVSTALCHVISKSVHASERTKQIRADENRPKSLWTGKWPYWRQSWEASVVSEPWWPSQSQKVWRESALSWSQTISHEHSWKGERNLQYIDYIFNRRFDSHLEGICNGRSIGAWKCRIHAVNRAMYLRRKLEHRHLNVGPSKSYVQAEKRSKEHGGGDKSWDQRSETTIWWQADTEGKKMFGRVLYDSERWDQKIDARALQAGWQLPFWCQCSRFHESGIVWAGSKVHFLGPQTQFHPLSIAETLWADSKVSLPSQKAAFLKRLPWDLGLYSGELSIPFASSIRYLGWPDSDRRHESSGR
jgi:hypothetical protein